MLGTDRMPEGRLNISDATELIEQLKKKKIKSKDLVEQSINLVKQSQNTINAAVQIFEDAASQKAKSGPLAGLPISVKETFGMQGLPITAGSKRMPPIIPDKDCAIIEKLKKAGAIIVARSNIPEFAMSHESENLLYGRTSSPLNLKHISGGSSGGEAALVGYGAVSFGVGSDIGGSIRYPAQCCGVVGFKPASSAVDGEGTFPVVTGYTKKWLAWGPIARSARDIRLVYNVIANEKIKQKAKQIRLLIPEDFRIDYRKSNIVSALTRAKHVLAREGVSIEKVSIPEAGQIYTSFISMIIHDFEKPMHDMLVTKDAKKLSMFAELFRQLFGKPTVWWGLYMTLAGMPVLRPSPKKVAKTMRFIDEMIDKYYNIFGSDGILLLPTSGDVALKHKMAVRIDNRPGVQGVFTPTVFCNALDLPSISIPAYSDVHEKTGLPPGVMLASAPGGESALLTAAEIIEPALRQK